MKIWILTGKFGQGHYSAAKALEEEFLEQGHEVVISDIVELLYPKLSKSIYYTFNNLICRNSTIYNFINELGRKQKKNRIHFNNSAIDKAIQSISPDIIVTTWSACAREISGYSIPVYVCITDMGIHQGWIERHVQGYLVATEDVKKKLLNIGLDEDKIHIFGIPVKKAFKEAYKKNIDTKKLLIMGGGLGILPWIDQLLSELKGHKDIKITVITGNNKRLFEKIRRKHLSVKVVGYTREVHKYMKEANLLISKPGGVSIFECIYTETPCIAVFPEYKQEIENSKFIASRKIGEVVWQGEDIGTSALNLLMNDKKLMEYQANIVRLKQEIESAKQEEVWCEYENAI